MINLTVKFSGKFLLVFCLFLSLVFLLMFDLYLSLGDNKMKAGELAERIEYINSLGYSVDESSEIIAEMQVPNVFNEAFQDFNSQMKTKGFNLEKVKGKKIKRYMYKANGANISLFVYDDFLVGYDVRTN